MGEFKPCAKINKKAESAKLSAKIIYDEWV